MVPRFGDHILQEIFELIFEQRFDPQDYSVLSGIFFLYEEGGFSNWTIATVLLLFSVAFPTAKLVNLALLVRRPPHTAKSRLDWLTKLGPWSMADVFVVSLTVLAFKAFPGGTRIYVAIGYYFFLASVLLAMAATYMIKKRLPGIPTPATKALSGVPADPEQVAS